MDAKLKGGLYGCIAAVSYGLNPLCALLLYREGIDTGSVLFYRFAFAAVILGLMMVAGRQSFRLTRREGVVLGALGALFAVSSLTYFLSFHYMAAGVAATLVFAYPVMVAVIMALCFRERLAWPAVVAMGLTVGGIGLLCRDDAGGGMSAMGFVIIMVSALTYALYIVVINRSRIVMSSVKLTFYALLVCLLFITVFSLAGATPLQWLRTPWEWLWAALLGLVPTVVSLVYMAKAIGCIGSTPTAIMGALEPVTAVAIGTLVFGEAFSLRLGVGVVLILVAVVLIILGGRVQNMDFMGRVVRAGRLVWKHWRWK